MMTYWRCRIEVNPVTNWHPVIYFALSGDRYEFFSNEVMEFVEELTGYKTRALGLYKIKRAEYAWRLLTLPVTNHRDFVQYKKSVVIE